jgi:hypothetical protein
MMVRKIAGRRYARAMKRVVASKTTATVKRVAQDRSLKRLEQIKAQSAMPYRQTAGKSSRKS